MTNGWSLLLSIAMIPTAAQIPPPLIRGFQVRVTDVRFARSFRFFLTLEVSGTSDLATSSEENRAHILNESSSFPGPKAVVLGFADVPFPGTADSVESHPVPVSLEHEGVPVGQLTLLFSSEVLSCHLHHLLGFSAPNDLLESWLSVTSSRCRINWRLLSTSQPPASHSLIKISAKNGVSGETNSESTEAPACFMMGPPRVVLTFPSPQFQQWAISLAENNPTRLPMLLSLDGVSPFYPLHLSLNAKDFRLRFSVTVETKDRQLVSLRVSGLTVFSDTLSAVYQVVLHPQTVETPIPFFSELSGNKNQLSLANLCTGAPVFASDFVKASDFAEFQPVFLIPESLLTQGLTVSVLSCVSETPQATQVVDTSHSFCQAELTFSDSKAKKILSFLNRKAEADVEVIREPIEQDPAGRQLPGHTDLTTPAETNASDSLRAAFVEEIRLKSEHFASLMKEHEHGLRLFRRSQEALEHQQKVLETLQKENDMLQRQISADNALGRELGVDEELESLSPTELKRRLTQVAQVFAAKKARNDGLRMQLKEAERWQGQFDALEAEKRRLGDLLRDKNEELRRIRDENQRREQLTDTLAQQGKVIAELEAQLERKARGKLNPRPNRVALEAKTQELARRVAEKRPELFGKTIDVQKRVAMEVELRRTVRLAVEEEARLFGNLQH